MNLAGKWKAVLSDGKQYDVTLPGTLDTNGVGEADRQNIDSRFTRVHTYTGEVQFGRKIQLAELLKEGKRSFLEVERARCLKLEINGENVSETGKGTLTTPYVFEITDALADAAAKGLSEAEVTILSDNSYQGLPQQGILTSSAATDETQTNWNGLLGYIRIRQESMVFIDSIRVYPQSDLVNVEMDFDAGIPYEGTLRLHSDAFIEDHEVLLQLNAGERKTVILSDISLKPDVNRWDEFEGNLYTAEVSGKGMETKTVSFGIRDFGVNDSYRLTINNRVFFLRGEANCAVFPEKGHTPMTENEWKEILETYASYGVNCMRFHSWCPPNAAFTAADKMGMMMQPELSHWDWSNAFGTEESCQYYRKELTQILKFLANHPSFVMLSFGNELWSEGLGEENKEKLLDYAHELDRTRLFAGSSNGHYGQWGTDRKSDFYTSHDYKEFHLRGASTENAGHINENYPNTKSNYNPGVARVHAEGKPVFSFEVGQFEILPDFKETEEFHGVTRPVNYEIIRENAQKSGRLKHWEEWIEATGEIALKGYQEEVEAALRTEGLSGLSLLGLQDFPGQGTALVGMLNSHLKQKPYDFAKPERFRKFFAPVVPLLYLDKYTYWNDEVLCAEIKLANYGKEAVTAAAKWQIYMGQQLFADGEFEKTEYPNGGLRTVGTIQQTLSSVSKAAQMEIVISVGKHQNSYPIWVYPKKTAIPKEMQNGYQDYYDKEGTKVIIAEVLNETVLDTLEKGGKVYLEPQPTKENLPKSIGGQFTTDFWSVGTFPNQEGGMGMVVAAGHPIFRDFPTEKHTDWQWWQMVSGRPIILPEHITPILTVPDSYSRLKHMGLLFEAKVGNGTIMMSGMGLHDYPQYPETVSLLDSILNYMASKECMPAQEMSVGELKELVHVL